MYLNDLGFTDIITAPIRAGVERAGEVARQKIEEGATKFVEQRGQQLWQRIFGRPFQPITQPQVQPQVQPQIVPTFVSQISPITIALIGLGIIALILILRRRR